MRLPFGLGRPSPELFLMTISSIHNEPSLVLPLFQSGIELSSILSVTRRAGLTGPVCISSNQEGTMKVRISFFSVVFVCLMFLTVLVLDNPSSASAQSPHTCLANMTGHQTSPLNRTNTFTFNFAQNCPPNTSSTISWKWSILRYSDNVQVCSGGPQNVPPTPIQFTCSSLPVGQYVKVIIYYQTTSGGSWMSHSELFSN